MHSLEDPKESLAVPSVTFLREIKQETLFQWKLNEFEIKYRKER